MSDPHNLYRTYQPTAEERASAASLSASEEIPGFEILDEVGRGGMGIVYRAKQTRLNRVVALKLISAAMQAGGSKEVQRFLAEAESMAAVSHPNVVPVYECGVHQGRPYLASEFCSGGTLGEYITDRETTFKPDEAAKLIEDIAHGVAAAHAQGIVHRDLKPGNVLFSTPPMGSRHTDVALAGSQSHTPVSQTGTTKTTAGGVPKVIDFGLAKQGSIDLTRTGSVLGTPAYMAPEQATGGGKFVTPAADVWSLGVMLYELLSGKKPFDGETAMDIMMKVVQTDPPPIRAVNPRVPKSLAMVCGKCLAKAPHERYQSAGELADDLARYRRDEPVSARPINVVERAALWVKRKPTAAAAIFIGTVAVALTGFAVGAVSLLTQEAAARRSAEVEQKNTAAALAETKVARDEAEEAKAKAEAERAKADEARKLADEARKLAEDRRAEVEKQKEKADQATTQAVKARDLLAVEQDKLAQVQYGQAIQVAYQEYRDNNAAATLRLVEGTRLALRGWEHRYVDALCRAELLSLRGHTQPVRAAAYTADGKRAVTGGDDGVARVYDLATGKETRAGLRHGSAVTAVAVDRSGRWAATAGTDGLVKVWDLTSGNPRYAPIKAHPAIPNSLAGANAVAFTPDGTVLVSGGNDTLVKLWDAATGQPKGTPFAGNVRPVNGVAVSGDGKWVASAGADGVARMWDLAGGTAKRQWKGTDGEVYSVAFVGNEPRRVVTGGLDGQLRLWNVDSDAPIVGMPGHIGQVWGVTASPDGRRLASAGLDGTVRVWNAQSASEVAVLRGHIGYVNGVAFSPTEDRVLSAGADGTARLWDPNASPEYRTLTGLKKVVMWARFSPDGKRLVAGTSDDATARVWDAVTGKELSALPLPTAPRVPLRAAVITGDEVRGVTSDGSFRRWDAANGTEKTTARLVQEGVRVAAVSPDGKLALLAGAPRDGVKDGLVRLCDTERATVLFPLTGHEAQVTAAEFSPDGKWVATASLDETARLWEVATGKPVAVLKHELPVRGVAFRLGGAEVATVGNDSSLRVWDIATRKVRMVKQGHSSAGTAVAYAPDGKRIATAGFDGTVRIWDADAGTELLAFHGFRGAVFTVTFSPDGRRLAAGGFGGEVRVYDAPPPGGKAADQEARR